MSKPMQKEHDESPKIWIILCSIAAAMLFLFFILTLRGILNAMNQSDFIRQRLDDYPHLYENYLEDTQEWWTWWSTEDYGKRANQAAYIFKSDTVHEGEAEKLEYIRTLVGAESAEITDEAGFDAVYKRLHEKNLNTCKAKLDDGRLIVLGMHGSLKESRMAVLDDSEAFLKQLQAGLNGYVLIFQNNEMTIYPHDELSENIRQEIEKAIADGTIKVGQGENTESFADSYLHRIQLKNTPDTQSKGRADYSFFVFKSYSSEYDATLINVVGEDDILRIGRKRSWSLWFLCVALALVLGMILSRTRLFRPEDEDEKNRYFWTPGIRRGFSAFMLAMLILVICVMLIQKISSVNLSARSAADETEYVKSVLEKETQSAAVIKEQFDVMYSERANTAAAFLSTNPQHIDMNSLHEFNATLDGDALQVLDEDGNIIASDRLLHAKADAPQRTSYTAVLKDASDQDVGSLEVRGYDSSAEEMRVYRSIMKDSDNRTLGLVELYVKEEQLSEVLSDTSINEVIEDLEPLDTMHVVVLDNIKENIVASTWHNWTGDKAEEHGIHTDEIFDGYDGIVSFEGNDCYAVVFAYGNRFVVVGSEDASDISYLIGVLVLFLPLSLILALVVYLPYTKNLYVLQRSGASHIRITESGKENYPDLWLFIKWYMLAVFLLSANLFFVSKGNPTGLTYNMVRGTWVRGLSAVTITTSIMLISVVFAVQTLIDIFLERLSKFMSPRGKTICRLIDSVCAYIGVIVLILYELTMLGVNTATLVGGVGATALVFTLAAHSLIADFLAGIFIIFEGDFTVGDVVVIGDFRGIVIDISMRTTKLMDDSTRDIKIVNNSTIQELINQSRERSTIMMDIEIGHDIGLIQGEKMIREALKTLPERFPKIIGTPEYWGVVTLPKKNSINGNIGGLAVRIAFSCKENDREMLTYQVNRYFVQLVNRLFNDTTEVGTTGCDTDLAEPLPENEPDELPDHF